MPTCIIQIGNSDDKLSQRDWAAFCDETVALIVSRTNQIHFSGFAAANASWQNGCWVADINYAEVDSLCEGLSLLAAKYLQDSIAFTLGETKFVGPRL